MEMTELSFKDFQSLDDTTVALYLELPSPLVVLLQGYFELYEGIGTVQTIDRKRALISITLPISQMDTCTQVLQSLYKEIPWRVVESYQLT